MFRQSPIRLLALSLLLLAGAPPQKAAAQGTTTQRTCGRSTFLNSAAATTVQIVPVAADRYAGNEIFICGYTINASGAGNVTLVYGTGTNCATGQVAITPTYVLTAAGVVNDTSPIFRGLDVPAGNNLCVTTTGTATQIIVFYDNNPL